MSTQRSFANRARWQYGLLLPALFLAGCATQYQVPASGPTAKITVTTNNAHPTTIRIYENTTCEKGDRGDLLGNIDGVGASKVLTIPAGRPVTLRFETMYGIKTINTCAIPVTFVPDQGGNYAVDHQYGYFQGDGMDCRVTIDKVQQGPNGEAQKAKEPSAAKNENSGCRWSW